MTLIEMLSEIEWVEIVDCEGHKARLGPTLCKCGMPIVKFWKGKEFGHWTYVVVLAERYRQFTYRDDTHPKTDWPWIVEQLVAEGALE